MRPEIIWINEQALTVRLGNEISPTINDCVLALAASLQNEPVNGICEWTPSYSELLIEYNPRQISFNRLRRAILKRLKIRTVTEQSGRQIVLPVCYSGVFAPDLTSLAQYCGLGEEELVTRHLAVNYRVYMLGFSPGFCYLGGLDPKLHAPRLKDPRLKVPAGSIGIADKQTGIYSLESPGGWQIIGRCPLCLFQPQTAPFFFVNPGDCIRFRAIDGKEFQEIADMSQKDGVERFFQEDTPS